MACLIVNTANTNVKNQLIKELNVKKHTHLAASQENLAQKTSNKS